MARTVGKRIQRTVLLAVLLTLAVTITSVYVANENLERAVLELDLRAERDFLLQNAPNDRPLLWDTASLKAYYLPPGVTDVPQRMPAVFDGLPFPFSGEVEQGEATYLVTLAEAAEGHLYIAKNITLFEQRETDFLMMLAVIAVAVIGCGLLIGWLTSQRLAQPLQQLASHIARTQPSLNMPRVELDLQDRELRDIAETFDRFLDELEAYVQREQSLLSLASHELRTPVAVIGGALDVIEQRGQLGTQDQRTLQRVRRANDDMQRNVGAILHLTRRMPAAAAPEPLNLPELAREVVDELERAGVAAPGRIALNLAAAPCVTADRALVMMLLRNLARNAVEHTRGAISIEVGAQHMEVADCGAGLPIDRQRYLAGPAAPPAGGGLSGLGLFIVTLICEKLGWQLSVEQASDAGTTLRVAWPAT